MKDEHLRLQLESLKIQFADVTEQQAQLQEDHKTQFGKNWREQEQSRLSQEQAMANMTVAQKRSEENLQAELNSLGQQKISICTLIE